MATIANAGNTENPCLLALRAKGYRLTLWYDSNGKYRSSYDAEKEGRRFIASSAQELLGLVAMWEMRGDDWKMKPNEPDIFDELATVALTYDDEGNVVDEDDGAPDAARKGAINHTLTVGCSPIGGRRKWRIEKNSNHNFGT